MGLKLREKRVKEGNLLHLTRCVIFHREQACVGLVDRIT